MSTRETTYAGAGARLRAWREAHGISLRTLERLDPEHLQRWRTSRLERGLRPLRVDVLAAYAQALGRPDLVKALRPFTDEASTPRLRTSTPEVDDD